ncbi:EamA family transporter [Gottfriedia acidiceleris]|uniref:EamA family transporter n=1 Tax=Gottfriedia acidiceleris TaxID=371036 RepID=UPI001F22CD94|nr:EamA family transporter [Gottfriedia acidiceleris]
MKLKDGIALFSLAALWGASFLFIRIASPVFGPILTIQGRVTIAAFALVLYLVITKKSLQFKKRWRQYLIMGALNAAIPFTLIATSALYLTASMSSILNSLTPLFTALVLWV